MAELRPKGMTTEQFSGMMRKHGFPACSRAAISLAERPNESGVQFTQRFRNAAQDLLNAPRRKENRKNGNKTTVWLDDELREWVEKEAYLTDSCVGELIRKILRQAMENDAAKKYKAMHWMNPEYNERFLKYNVERKTLADIVCEAIEKAASDAATSEAAGGVERTDCHGPAGLAMTGTIPSASDHNT